MQRNNYSEATKKFFSRKNFFGAGFFFLGASEASIGWFSDFVVNDAGRLSPIFRLINLEIRKEGRTLALEKLEHRHRATANLELGALARSQLQHRAPGAGVGGDHDFRLGGVG